MEELTSLKTHITLVAIGHVASGKSTTLGHLVFKCGEDAKKSTETLEDKVSRSSFKYAENQCQEARQHESWRKNALTCNCSATWQLETQRYHCTIVDTPGHKKYAKNMIRGASIADVAILVVSASNGEFETGVSRDGQTREHSLLAFTFGVKQMICCISKMDTVNWSQERYTEIVLEVSGYLKKVRYNPDSIPFIPISGWNGDNLIDRSLHTPWYTGPNLLESIDLIVPVKYYPEKPLRLPVWDIYKISGVGSVPVGRVETGILKPGMSVAIARADNGKHYVLSHSDYLTTEVNSVEMHHQSLTVAVPGNYVGISIKRISVWDIPRGSVISDPSNDPARICRSFIAQVLVLSHPNQIQEGYIPLLFCHTAHVPCRFDKLLSTIDYKTGAVIEEEPKFIKNGDCALVRMVPLKGLCVERYAEYPQLGRFAVRDLDRTVALGLIKHVNST